MTAFFMQFCCLQVTAIHNHLVGEPPAVKYVHFSGRGDALELAEFVKSVISVTGTPLNLAPVATSTALPDWIRRERL